MLIRAYTRTTTTIQRDWTLIGYVISTTERDTSNLFDWHFWEADTVREGSMKIYDNPDGLHFAALFNLSDDKLNAVEHGWITQVATTIARADKALAAADDAMDEAGEWLR